MNVISLPSIDGSPCSRWSPQQRNLYTQVPEAYRHEEVKSRKKYGSWRKLFGRRKSDVGMAAEMFSVVHEAPPMQRQWARPTTYNTRPKVDVTQYLDRKIPYTMHSHRFESLPFHWLPSFEDWVKDKLNPSFKYVMQAQEEYMYAFHRTFMVDYSNYVYIAGYGMVEAPVGQKDDGWWEDAARKCKSSLTISELIKCMRICENEVGMVPFQSSEPKDDHFIADKFCLHTSGETYDGFLEDPWVAKMKTDSMDLIYTGFKGQIGGRITSSLHSHPLRCLVAANGGITWPEPETIITTPESFEFRRTVPNKDYSKNAQVEVHLFTGYQGYDILDPGPPPAAFTAKKDLRNTPLSWNGKPFLTDDLLITEYTEGGDIAEVRPNNYGEFIKIQSWLQMGIAPKDIRQVVPIVALRHGQTLA